MNNVNRGFTLIELIIAVAIIGILAVVAYPSFQDQVAKSKRSEAKSALLKLVDLQERNYIQNNVFTSEFGTGANKINYPTTSENGYYTFNGAVDNTAGTYSFTATNKTGDAGCTTLVIDQAGKKTSTGTESECW